MVQIPENCAIRRRELWQQVKSFIKAGSEGKKKLGLFRNKTHGGLFSSKGEDPVCCSIERNWWRGKGGKLKREGLGMKTSELNWEGLRKSCP